MHEPRRQPRLRFGPVAGREFGRLNPRAGKGLESRNAGLSKSFGGDNGRGRSPNEGKAETTTPRARTAIRARVESRRSDLRRKSRSVRDRGRQRLHRLLARRFAADRSRPSSLAQSVVLMTNDADRKGSRALTVEGRTNRAVLCSPERGAARQCGILRHLLLERLTFVRLKAVVHVGVQIREAPSLHHLTTRKCGTVLGGAAGSGQVKAATRSRAFVSRAISVASEISRAEAAS